MYINTNGLIINEWDSMCQHFLYHVIYENCNVYFELGNLAHIGQMWINYIKWKCASINYA